MTAPLVVTVALDDEAQRRLDAERRRWFPAGRTAVGAHLTLFHALPGELEAQVRADLADQTGPAFAVRLERVASLGRGAAYAIESAELSDRHRALQRAWWPHLTAQDRQGFRPHVTIATKLDQTAAREIVETLRTTFMPHDVAALGFDLWRYDGGPWTRLTTIPFR